MYKRQLFFPSEPIDDLVVGILDDGEGMSAGVLFEAMRYGSRDSEGKNSLTTLQFALIPLSLIHI